MKKYLESRQNISRSAYCDVTSLYIFHQLDPMFIIQLLKDNKNNKNKNTLKVT